MKNLMMGEEKRMMIMASDSFQIFPQPFVSLLMTHIKKKEHYIILKDHIDLPMWTCERNDEKKHFMYSLGEALDYEIFIFLCDTGSVYIDIYSNIEKRYI